MVGLCGLAPLCLDWFAFVELLGVGSPWTQLVRVPWAQVALCWVTRGTRHWSALLTVSCFRLLVFVLESPFPSSWL